ncbi:MAG: polyphosphate kinase 2 [Desulfobacula sp.]|jgi:polyphosphate kinase 2|uniref:polyphosphate kinase 2 n=1 Tax=Desulfobacula sp. TaxID=2593537 RepID=UPI001DBE5247|nr:polyphosphate kinase 2 [Desulfobacula sp.]MBT3803073.1 polyphosphate kinase 2 [Desulfobacula sp.]MBT4023415.1 polyphosphate kinase 2 [Desulfobacula sp.]MBT4197121.1 polyphosphate kinase 2 [Desulfobacula sp.]MBT4507328.1 polyphosphate kinase 2 [Desulfobacula sp.]
MAKEKNKKKDKAEKKNKKKDKSEKKANGKNNKETKLKTKLSEHTSLKNKDKKKSKKRQAVWVKKFTLEYEEELKTLQIELLKWQKYVIANEDRVLLLFEGRDAAGKGGTIKRIIEHLNPRGARVVALLKPSDRERTQWYFQRYIQHLPFGGEIVLFDRSWYNRAMVEPTMNFCTDEENKRFLKDVPMLESMLVKNGIQLFKFFFSVSKNEQMRRFTARETDPLKQYKISPVDREAQERWDDYTLRKFQMLNETNRSTSPWTIIRSDNKKKARLNCIKYILSQVDYKDKISDDFLQIDPEILVSGIDEIRFMEDNLMTDVELPG